MSAELLPFLYTFTGISLGFATISLIIGFQKKRDPVFLFFGFIGLTSALYYLLFPIYPDAADSDFVHFAGTFLIITAFGLLPWFFGVYTGYKVRSIQWSLTGVILLDYLLFVLSAFDLLAAIYWLILSHILQAGIILYGFLSVNHQWKAGEKKSGIVLLITLIIMTLFSIDDILLHYFPSILSPDFHGGLLPLDFFPVLFMIIIGGRIAKEIQIKEVLHKELLAKDKRLTDILNRISLLVIQVDKDGSVVYTNQYFHELTGYSKEEVIQHQYTLFIPEATMEDSTNKFDSVLSTNTNELARRLIQTKEGDILNINWSVVTLFDTDEKPVGIISVGADISDQVKAYEEIETLKKQLEKENIFLKSELGKVYEEEEIIGKSEAIRYVINRAKEVAATDAIIILEGETGVGKDLVAQFIHKISAQKNGPFISVNCAAIPKDLLESELFGYEKGAFTGATGSKKGRVEQADNGTLFLDEIGDMPLDLQPKILRFIQEGTFDRLGSEKGRHVNVRIITATNKNLKEEVDLKNFREDLYYRIHVFPITIPPLRKRRSDIPLLTRFFVDKFSKKYKRTITEISQSDKELLQTYDWPGNVRELENVIESSIIGSKGNRLSLANEVMNGKRAPSSGDGQPETLEQVERNHILYMLEQCNWRISGDDGAASRLGLHPNTLRSRMAKLKISKTFK